MLGDEQILFELRRTNSLLRRILSALRPDDATKIAFLFGKIKGEEHMPLTLPVGDQDNYYLYGTAPTLGALLGPGQSLQVTSADPNTVVITPDPTPIPVRSADATSSVPAGTPTIQSGIVSSPTSPAQLGVPITIIATVLNSDGSTAETLTDTVTVSPTAATAIGDLFGAATPLTSSSLKKK
jgi:hypothetical protein